MNEVIGKILDTVYDIPFWRLEFICQAEREGRLVVLPLKEESDRFDEAAKEARK